MCWCCADAIHETHRGSLFGQVSSTAAAAAAVPSQYQQHQQWTEWDVVACSVLVVGWHCRILASVRRPVRPVRPSVRPVYQIVTRGAPLACGPFCRADAALLSNMRRARGARAAVLLLLLLCL